MSNDQLLIVALLGVTIVLFLWVDGDMILSRLALFSRVYLSV
ncbi:hypothetical protein JCM19236_2619 [Vibrio sp. JCM 19236]|nr:hypothetical protein JCM19236_2619 [Vibrio sp. JCM 19236]